MMPPLMSSRVKLQIQQLFGPTGVGAGADAFQRALFELEDPPALRLQPLDDASPDVKPREDSVAHQKYKSGNFKQALEHRNIIYEKNPRRTDNLLLLSTIYYQMYDFDMCITKNEEALAVNPWFQSNMVTWLMLERRNAMLILPFGTIYMLLRLSWVFFHAVTRMPEEFSSAPSRRDHDFSAC